MLERSVACSDLSSLHSYFSTGIVRLMSPLHNRCHLSVRMPVSAETCSEATVSTANQAIVRAWETPLLRQALDTLSKPRQGGWGEQTVLAERCFQVGLLTTIGLASKNAILIVKFAKEQFEAGHGLIEATLNATRLRLRPILMSSFAFILGVLPLALASGAGSGSQNAIGVGVIGGMLTGTILAILFVPVFF